MSNYEISKSSLLSLKAEILRKQDEFAKVKQDNAIKLANIKKNNTPLIIKNKGIDERKQSDGTGEEDNILKKSRESLEAKSKLYEKLSQQSPETLEENYEENKQYLVQFSKKNAYDTKLVDDQREPLADRLSESDNEGDMSDDLDPSTNPDEEWVEFVDCMGRTRTCLKKDLAYLKSDDAKLREEMEEKRGTPLTNSGIEGENNSDKNAGIDIETSEKNEELLSFDMRRELLRQKWEQEENELRNKTNIHYEDVLFDEARSHGVGYYGFSKDEEERRKQQESLHKLRVETVEQQKKVQELRNLREKQMAARLKAARNRKRARMGLPPEEDDVEPEKPAEPNIPLEEPSKTVIDETEIAREHARKKHIRPWDIGKEGVKEHYVYTQEEWIDKKRKERPAEFAPPSFDRKDFRSTVSQSNEITAPEFKSLRFSTKKKNSINKWSDQNSVNPYKNNSHYEHVEQPKEIDSTPIVNECEDFQEDYTCVPEPAFNVQNERGKGVEIAPPPTYDYYGPNDVKKQRTDPSGTSLEDSINAGLKYLRNQMEMKEKSTKHPDQIFLM